METDYSSLSSERTVIKPVSLRDSERERERRKTNHTSPSSSIIVKNEEIEEHDLGYNKQALSPGSMSTKNINL